MGWTSKLAQHEASVVDHRLTWLLAGQPFAIPCLFQNVITTRSGKGEAVLDPEAYKHAAAVLPCRSAACSAFAVWLGVLGLR